MGLKLKHGGHLSHGFDKNIAAMLCQSIQYGVDVNTGLIDLENLRYLALKHNPVFIWVGATAYSRYIPFEEFGKIADECGAYLVADISHISGLIVGGAHPSPVPDVHILTTTTQKLLGGPKGGILMATEKGINKDPKLPYKLDNAIFPMIQGGPIDGNILGISAAMQYSLTDEYKDYTFQVVENAKILCDNLQKSGIKIVSGGTDNHLMILDFSEIGIGRGVFIEIALEYFGITANKNTTPEDLSSPFYPSGIRIGTPSITRRGAKRVDMDALADIIVEIIHITIKILDDTPEMGEWPFIKGKNQKSKILKLFQEKLINLEQNESLLCRNRVEFFIKNVLSKNDALFY